MERFRKADSRNKKLTEDGGTYEQISHTMLYNLGLLMGLTVRDIDSMTVGELIDISYYRANQEEERKNRKKEDRTVKATQADYDAF